MSFNGKENLKDIMFQLEILKALLLPMIQSGSVYNKGEGYTSFHGPIEMLMSFLQQIKNRNIILKLSKDSSDLMGNCDPNLFPQNYHDDHITITPEQAHATFKEFYEDGKSIPDHLNKLLDLTKPMLHKCPYEQDSINTDFHHPIEALTSILGMYKNGLFIQKQEMDY